MKLVKLLAVGAGVVGLAGGGVWVGSRASRKDTELPAPQKRALGAELSQLKRDQRARARQVSAIAQDPKVRRQPDVYKAAKELGAKQAEVALLADRTERMMQADDPRARAYQRALGRSLAEVDRSAHALNQVAFKRGLAPRPLPQWVQSPSAPRPPPWSQAQAKGRPRGLAVSLAALDVAYDWSRYAYQRFDRSWALAYRGVPQTAWAPCDVYAEIHRLPRAEVAYVFQNYFTAYDYSFYATAMNVQPFSEIELHRWSGVEHYDESYPSEPLTPDWTDDQELAALEHDYGLTSELAFDENVYDHELELEQAQADYEQAADLYPNDAYGQGEGVDVASAPEADGHAPPHDDGQYAPQDDGQYAPQDDGHHAPQDDGHHAPQDDGHHAPQDDGHHAPHDDGQDAPHDDGQ